MSKTRKSLRDSQQNSPEGSDDDDLRSPVSEIGEPISPTVTRGRKGKSGSNGDEIEERDAMDVLH